MKFDWKAFRDSLRTLDGDRIRFEEREDGLEFVFSCGQGGVRAYVDWQSGGGNFQRWTYSTGSQWAALPNFSVDLSEEPAREAAPSVGPRAENLQAMGRVSGTRFGHIGHRSELATYN